MRINQAFTTTTSVAEVIRLFTEFANKEGYALRNLRVLPTVQRWFSVSTGTPATLAEQVADSSVLVGGRAVAKPPLPHREEPVDKVPSGTSRLCSTFERGRSLRYAVDS